MHPAAHNHQIDYIEFTSTNLSATESFFAGVFGWAFTSWGDTYISFSDERLTGGFSHADTAAPEGGPLVILFAVDLVACNQAVCDAGGQITEPIFPFPGGWRFHFREPGGNILAVWSDR